MEIEEYNIKLLMRIATHMSNLRTVVISRNEIQEIMQQLEREYHGKEKQLY